MSDFLGDFMHAALEYCEAVNHEADKPLREALWSIMIRKHHEYTCSTEYRPTEPRRPHQAGPGVDP